MVQPCSTRANILAGVLSMHALMGTLPPSDEHVCTVFAGGGAGRGVAEASAGATGAVAAATAHDIGCALRIAGLTVGGMRSFSSLLLWQGPVATGGTGRSPRRASAAAAQRRHAAVQRAFLDGSNSSSHVTVSATTSDAPTVRAVDDGKLPRGRCSLLLLQMYAASANVRQSMRIDLPHILRLGAPDAPVVALSPKPCQVFPPGIKARDLNASDKYSGPL